ncbi:hypothetical protein MMYC01_203786 [Madurella mycetomatis]|uniref:Uncharacterized protein n=1 Tax=Madurella mycetomatis TaxID=100816 RepID=A0A175W892_9PEZI|nr:hypothetical protein MMYC01_203786 [Madurella mycetomatis]
MTPYLGKGATSAIADAIALAERLGGLITAQDGDELKRALDRYTVGMLESGFGMAKKSKLVHNIVFAGSTPLKAHMRNAVLRLLGFSRNLVLGRREVESLA